MEPEVIQEMVEDDGEEYTMTYDDYMNKYQPSKSALSTWLELVDDYLKSWMNT